MKYDVVVAYRFYPGISKNPFLRSNDKLWMICGGLSSLKRCLGDLKAKFYLIDDGCPWERKEKITQSLWDSDYSYIFTEKIGNYATFKKQVEILSTQNESDYVYFAEDDYLYTDWWFSEWIEMLKNKKADFISFFDHRAHYKAYHHKIKHEYIIDDVHLRIRKSIASTCMTFLTSKEVLVETKPYLLWYCKWTWDYPLRLGLTKQNLRKIIDIDRNYIDRMWIPTTWLHTAMLWIKCRKQLLFGKRYKLLCPIPGICTHLETEDKAPLVDRSEYAKS